MAGKRKLLARVRNNPKDVRFSDLLALVEEAGFVPIRKRGTSHRRYVHPEVGVYLNLQPDKQGKAKPYQVDQFLKAVDKYHLQQEEDEG